MRQKPSFGQPSRRRRGGGDRIGEGLGQLWLGDLLAAPDAPLLSGQRWLRESSRGALDFPGSPVTLPPGDDGAALDAWAAAEALFFDWEPGLAAVLLGRGLLHSRAGRWGEAQRELALAERRFIGCGVWLGAEAAALHRALAEVGDGGPPGAPLSLLEGQGLVQAGSLFRSLSFTMGLAMTALVYAWRALEERGGAAVAAHSARIALALLEPLAVHHAAGQALLAVAELSALAHGRAAALGPLEQAWDRALLLRGTTLSSSGQALASAAAYAGLGAAIDARDPVVIARQGARLELVSDWGVEEGGRSFPAPDLVAPLLHTSLIRIGLVVEEGDMEAWEAALRSLEEGARGLPEPGRWLWEATALAWRGERWASLERWLRYDEARATEAETETAPDPAQAMMEAKLRRRARRDRGIERAAFFSACQSWERGLSEVEQLDREHGPEGWSEEARPWETFSLRAELLDGAGRNAEAALAWERAWAAVEERRGGLLLGDADQSALSGDRVVHGIGRGAVRTALHRWEQSGAAPGGRAREHLEEAFRWSERVRARGLTELLSLSRSPLRQSAAAALPRWQAARARKSALEGLLLRGALFKTVRPSLEARIDEEGAKIDRLEAELVSEAPALGRLLRPPHAPPSLAELQAGLPPGSFFLAFDVYDTGLLSWVIPASGEPAVHRLPLDRFELTGPTRQLLLAITAGEEEHGAGERLSALLLEPLREALDQSGRLFISPSGPLFRLPFVALPWRGGCLGDHHVVSMLPSAAALPGLRLDRPLGGLDGAVIIGDPARMAWQPLTGGSPIPLASLPGAAREARAVAARCSAPLLLVGEEATEAAVTAALPGARLLHIASHGRFEPAAPLLSAVALADGGLLDVATLLGAKLQAELVVLSACETSQGAVRGGELLGLSRGLLAAGAGSVLLSLWPVDDAATSALMVALYEGLAAGLPTAMALQRAMWTIRAKSRAEGPGEGGAGDREMLLDMFVEEEPRKMPDRRRDWAAFVLIG